MKTIALPYGRSSMQLHIEENRLAGILTPHAESCGSPENEETIVRKSLAYPIGSPRLSELARGARHVLVITSDHTRPVPSRITMPLLLEEIRKFNRNAEIRILVATGLHRPTTPEELNEKLGPEILAKETICIHNSQNVEQLVFKGTLPSGGKLWLNSLVDWADLVVAEGFIEPHFFAGFSGGRKSILPGIAGSQTVRANHCARFISDPACRTGNLEGNPIHEDMLFASAQSGLRFILNVVLDGKKAILRCFSGDPEKAHQVGCSFSAYLTAVSAVPSEIVVVANGGHPLDQNVYQTVKGMSAAEMTVKEGGVIIMVASCEDGHGGDAFYRWLAESSGPAEVAAKIATIPPEETAADQWQAQVLARILIKHRVILVTDHCDPKIITDMHMDYSTTPDEALKQALRLTRPDAKVTVIPDGVSVVVKNVSAF